MSWKPVIQHSKSIVVTNNTNPRLRDLTRTVARRSKI